jgi:hypothetical protein
MPSREVGGVLWSPHARRPALVSYHAKDPRIEEYRSGLGWMPAMHVAGHPHTNRAWVLGVGGLYGPLWLHMPSLWQLLG